MSVDHQIDIHFCSRLSIPDSRYVWFVTLHVRFGVGHCEYDNDSLSKMIDEWLNRPQMSNERNEIGKMSEKGHQVDRIFYCPGLLEVNFHSKFFKVLWIVFLQIHFHVCKNAFRRITIHILINSGRLIPVNSFVLLFFVLLPFFSFLFFSIEGLSILRSHNHYNLWVFFFALVRIAWHLHKCLFAYLLRTQNRFFKCIFFIMNMNCAEF